MAHAGRRDGAGWDGAGGLRAGRQRHGGGKPDGESQRPRGRIGHVGADASRIRDPGRGACQRRCPVRCRHGHDPETIDARLTGAGYTHELAEVTGRVAGGHTESEIMPLADTVAVQDVLGEIAGQLGIRVIEGPAELP